jgi:pimeloyl-ACP methyl ester carboxylesterase
VITRVALVALMALVPATARAFCADPAPVVTAAQADRILRIDTRAGRLAATLTLPGAPPQAAVLMLHGYTGSRDEFRSAAGEGTFTRAAQLLAERGVASLRIDFRGSGESDGAWEDTTPDSQAQDAAAALAALSGLPEAGGHPPAVLGFSMGGLAALSAGPAASRVVLWNPVVEPRRTFEAILGAAAFATAATGGDVLVGTTGLRPGFFAGIDAARPQDAALRLPVPLLIVAGGRDTVVPDGPSIADTLARGRTAPTQMIAPPLGHDLGAVSDLAAFDAVVACTAAFLLLR